MKSSGHKRTASTNHRISTKERWNKILSIVEEELRPETFQRWFSGIECAGITDDEITIVCPTSLHEFWIASNYRSLVRSATTLVLGSDRALRFTHQVAEANIRSLPSEFQTGGNRASLANKIPVDAVSLNPQNTFDSFVVGPNNEIANAASRAVAQSPGRTYNPLFIYGGAGLGKTHLLQAIALHVLEEHSKVRIAYVSSETFSNEFVTAIQNNTLVEFHNRYRRPDVLLIDDIQFLGDKGRTQEEFFHTFNTLFDGHKQIVLSSDRAPSEIANLESRLVSRFEWGLTTELQAPDIETRLAILRKKAAVAAVDIKEDLLIYLAKNIRTNVRRLEGALLRVAAYLTLNNGRSPTIEHVEHLLKDLLSDEFRSSITIEQIQRIVASHFDVRLADMTSKRRSANVAFPRQLAMYLSRELTRASFAEIGDAFGGKAASSAHQAHGSVRNRLQVDENLRHTASFLDRQLRRG